MSFVKCIQCGYDECIVVGFFSKEEFVCASCRRKNDAEKGEAIDTYNEYTIICPYCAHELDHSDACEMASHTNGTSSIDTCGNCGKDFEWEYETSITFSTSKTDQPEDEDDHQD